MTALEKSFERCDRIPIGLFYRTEQPTYEASEPALRQGPPVKRKLGLDEKVFERLVEELL